MKIKFKNITNLLLFFKYFSPIIALVYLCSWLIQGLNDNLFKFIDMFIGILPRIIDKFFPASTEIFEHEVTMGYVYSACVFAAFYYFSNIFIKKLEKLEKIQKNEEIKKRLVAQQAIKKMKQAEMAKRKKEKNTTNNEESLQLERKTFIGLFEFQLEYMQVYGKDPSNLRKLKNEFSKIMCKKLKEKYPDVEFSVNEKMFFSCENFSKFGIFTKDILMLFRTFMQTNAIQSIKTGMLFSYWASDASSDKKEAYKILSKINELGYLNQIIVSSGVYFRFMLEEDKKYFAFSPLGASKLTGVYDDKDIDLDIELYSITKVE